MEKDPQAEALEKIKEEIDKELAAERSKPEWKKKKKKK